MNNAFWRVLACASLSALLVACGERFTTEDFQRIEKGMARDKVIDVLGEPDDLSSMAIGELQGTNAQWRGDERMITVLFANGKVVFKSLGAVPPEQDNGDSS